MTSHFFRKLTVLSVAVATLLQSVTALASAQTELRQIEQVFTRLQPRLNEMNQVVVASFGRSGAASSLRDEAQGTINDLQELKRLIERAGTVLDDSEYDAFVGALLTYFRALGRVYVIRSAFGSVSSGPFTALTNDRLDEMRIVLPTQVANNVTRFMTLQASTGAGPSPAGIDGLAVYNNPSRAGTSMVGFSAVTRQGFGIEALRTYPSENLARDRLRLEVLADIMYQLAEIESHLPPGMRTNEVQWPSALPADDRSFLSARFLDSKRAFREAQYRPAVMQRIFRPLLRAAHAPDSDLSNAIGALANRVTQRFRHHLDPVKSQEFDRNAVLQAIVTDIQNVTAGRQAAIAGQGSEEETYDFLEGGLRYDLTFAPEQFHELRGEALENALREVIVTSVSRRMAFWLGCMFFKDGVENFEESDCFGGNRPHRIFLRANGWTPAELSELRGVVTSAVRSMYPRIPAEILRMAESLRGFESEYNASKARYRLATNMIDASRTLKNLLNQVDQILANPAEEHTPPEFTQGLAVNPGLMMLAMNRVGFLQTQVPVREWYGEILGNFASRSASERMTRALRIELQQRLIGATSVIRSMEGDVREIANAVGADAGMFNNIGSVRHQMHQLDCESWTNIVACLTQMSDWVRTMWSTRHPSQAHAFQPRYEAQIGISSNRILDSIIRLSREARANPQANGTVAHEIEFMYREARQLLRDDGSMRPLVNALNAFRDMFEIAGAYHSDSLQLALSLAYERLLNKDMGPMLALAQDLHNFRELLMGPGYELVTAIFSDTGTQNRFYHGLLDRPGVYIHYAGFLVQQLEAQMPGLREIIPLHSLTGYRHGSSSQEPVHLFEVIAELESRVANPGFLQDMAGAFERAVELRGSAGSYRSEVGRTNLIELTSGVANLTRAEGNLRVWEEHYLGARIAPGNDAWWVPRLRVVDALPAASDDRHMEECQNRRTGDDAQRMCILMKRSLRAVVATTLIPYLRSAQASKRNQLRDLADPRRPADAILVNTSSFNNVMGMAGPDAGRILNGMQAREMHEQRWLEMAQDRLRVINSAFFRMFQLSLLGGEPATLRGFFWSRVVGTLMWAPAVIPIWYVQGSLIAEYRHQFQMLQPYTFGNMTSRGIVSSAETARLRDAYFANCDELIHRAPMDIFWTVGEFQGWRAYLRARPSNRPGAPRGTARAPEVGEAAGGHGRVSDRHGQEMRGPTDAVSPADYRLFGLDAGANRAQVQARFARADARHQALEGQYRAEGRLDQWRDEHLELRNAFNRIKRHLSAQRRWTVTPEQRAAAQAEIARLEAAERAAAAGPQAQQDRSRTGSASPRRSVRQRARDALDRVRGRR